MATNGKRTIAGIAGAVTLGIVLAACGPKSSTGTGSSVPSIFTAKPTSTVAVTGEKDAKALVAHCIPASTLTQVQLLEPKKGKPAREAVVACMGVPKADDSAAEACALSRVEKGGKLPKGKQAKEETLLNEVYPCVKQYQGAK